MNTIFNRRSIRKFTKKSISERNLRKILSAAMAAPSACNVQPWEYIVIKNKESMKKIMEIHEHSKMLSTADTVILACSIPKKGMCEDMWPQDLSASVQNMLLEATYLGIGSCWLGVWPNKKRIAPLKKFFNLPDNAIPFALVAFGYPDEEKKPNDRYEEKRIHKEVW